MIIIHFFSPVIFSVTYEVVDKENDSFVCTTNIKRVWSKLYFPTIILIFYVVPLYLLVILYSTLAYHLIEKQILKYYTSKKFVVNHFNVARLLCTVIIIFCSCLLPFRIMVLWILFSPLHKVIEIGLDKYFLILYLTRILIYLNSSLNPLIYTLAVTKYRKYCLKSVY